MSNPVIFVSLGPGEPELITLKGLKALQSADCIFCPETRTTSGRILSRAADEEDSVYLGGTRNNEKKNGTDAK